MGRHYVTGAMTVFAETAAGSPVKPHWFVRRKTHFVVLDGSSSFGDIPDESELGDRAAAGVLTAVLPATVHSAGTSSCH